VELVTSRLGCPGCGTELSGHFARCDFCALDAKELELLRVFLSSRGNLREVEKHLGVSYPTARARFTASPVSNSAISSSSSAATRPWPPSATKAATLPLSGPVTPLVGLGEGVRFTDIPNLREEQPGHWVAPVPVGTVIEGGRS
jgi:hypothetical protein